MTSASAGSTVELEDRAAARAIPAAAASAPPEAAPIPVVAAAVVLARVMIEAASGVSCAPDGRTGGCSRDSDLRPPAELLPGPSTLVPPTPAPPLSSRD